MKNLSLALIVSLTSGGSALAQQYHCSGGLTASLDETTLSLRATNGQVDHYQYASSPILPGEGRTDRFKSPTSKQNVYLRLGMRAGARNGALYFIVGNGEGGPQIENHSCIRAN